jgi:hypothetical protein
MQYLDIFFIMATDFHGAWMPITGVNVPNKEVVGFFCISKDLAKQHIFPARHHDVLEDSGGRSIQIDSGDSRGCHLV